MRTILFLAWLSLASLSAFALETFTVEFQGKTLTLTKEIDSVFLGPYFSLDKEFRSGFYLAKPLKKSYQIWIDSHRKRFFEWGFLVKNNKLFLSKSQEKDPLGVVSKHYVLVRYFYTKKFHIALLTHKIFLDGRKDMFIFDDSFIKNDSIKIK